METVTMEESQLEGAVISGIWYPECPYCGCKTPAEPDAWLVCCQNCDKHFTINNPYF